MLRMFGVKIQERKTTKSRGLLVKTNFAESEIQKMPFATFQLLDGNISLWLHRTANFIGQC